MLHQWKGDEFKTATSSVAISEVMTSTQWSGPATDSPVGFWEATFDRPRELGVYRPDVPGQRKEVYERLFRMIISRESNMQRLVGGKTLST